MQLFLGHFVTYVVVRNFLKSFSILVNCRLPHHEKKYMLNAAWRETIHARPRLSMATAWDLPTLHPCQVVALAWGKLGAAFYDGFGTYATNSDRVWRLVARKSRAPKSPTSQECLDHFGILGRESSQTIGWQETHTECIQIDIAPVHRQTKIGIGFKFPKNSTAKIAQALTRLKLQS